MRLLLVEDHPGLRDMMDAHLRRSGFATDAVARGSDAIEAASTTVYDAAVLDLGLPDMDGMALLRHLRSTSKTAMPIILLTARDAVGDRVSGLDAGADDYILKPFDLDEFDARLRTVLRRPGRRRDMVERFGDLAVDTVAHSISVRGTPLALTRREAALVDELVRAGGRTLVRDGLADRIYGFNERASANALEAIVSRLRRSLTAAGSTVALETVRGIGYRLVSHDRGTS